MNTSSTTNGETAGPPCASCYAYVYCVECLAFLNSEGYLPNWFRENEG